MSAVNAVKTALPELASNKLVHASRHARRIEDEGADITSGTLSAEASQFSLHLSIAMQHANSA